MHMHVHATQAREGGAHSAAAFTAAFCASSASIAFLRASSFSAFLRSLDIHGGRAGERAGSGVEGMGKACHE